MKFRPTLDEIRQIAESGDYDIVPVSCELLSDFITPIETMRILKNVSAHCFMLESAHANDTWGRYTFLGYEPEMEITCINNTLKAGEITISTDDPSGFLRQLLKKYRSPHISYLPSFTGGLVGYFSYDYLKYSEPVLRSDVYDEDEFKDVEADVTLPAGEHILRMTVTGSWFDVEYFSFELPGSKTRLADVRLQTGFVAGSYSVFDLNGTFLGRVELQSAGEMSQKTKAMVHNGGMYILKSVDGARMYRIPVAK